MNKPCYGTEDWVRQTPLRNHNSHHGDDMEGA